VDFRIILRVPTGHETEEAVFPQHFVLGYSLLVPSGTMGFGHIGVPSGTMGFAHVGVPSGTMGRGHLGAGGTDRTMGLGC